MISPNYAIFTMSWGYELSDLQAGGGVGGGGGG